MLNYPLATSRLTLRRFTTQDESAIRTYATDPRVMHYLEEGPMTQEQVQAWLDNQCGEAAQAFPAILNQTGQLIGHMVFHLWFAPQTYEIGWVFHPAHQGKGYATEAAAALLRYAFVDLQAHRVIATCQPENPASYRIMEKIGMRREGYFRQCILRPDGVWWDEYFYAILAEEWHNMNL